MRRLLVLLLPLAVALTACRTTPRMTDTAAGFRAAVAEFASRPTLAAGSAEERAAIARFEGFLANITAANARAQTTSVYAPDCFFNDTLKTLRGSANVRDYFAATAENSESVTAAFDDATRSGDGLYYFRWVMDTRLKKIAKGQTIRTLGITVVRFDEQGRVLIHQDYWDSAVGLWDHVPVIGYGIRAIKARL